MSELWELSATDLAAKIGNREASATDAVEACISRIEAINPDINAVTVIYADEARAAAKAADARQANGEPLAPLHGVPFTVKENIDVKGWPCTWGLPAFENALAPVDAPVVAQFKQAGAIPIAATNLPDFALRWYSDSSLRGATRNPWDAKRTPGGSSGGAAAALATGMGPLALGNDVGGSLRYPAQCCGIASLRPSHGRIARASSTLPDEFSLGFQLMYVEGPMARSVTDLRLGFAAASHFDRRDPWWVPATVKNIANDELPAVAMLVDPGGSGVDQQVADGVVKAADTLANAGYPVAAAEPPHLLDAATMWQQLLFTEVRATMLDTVKQLASADAVKSLELCDPFIPDLNKNELIHALADRTRLFRHWLDFFERYPLIVGPVSTAIPFLIGDDILNSDRSREIMNSQRLVVTINLFGLPSVVVPVGVADGLPQAVQIIGAPFNDELCLQAAEVLEKKLGIFTPISPH